MSVELLLGRQRGQKFYNFPAFRSCAKLTDLFQPAYEGKGMSILNACCNKRLQLFRRNRAIKRLQKLFRLIFPGMLDEKKAWRQFGIFLGRHIQTIGLCPGRCRIVSLTLLERFFLRMGQRVEMGRLRA